MNAHLAIAILLQASTASASRRRSTLLALVLTVAWATAVLAGVTITEFDAPTGDGAPQMITAGPDGNLWFTEYPASKIGKISPSGVFTVYDVPAIDAGGLAGIAPGPDGNLWFTVNFDDKVGKVTPSGTFTLYDVPTPGASPWGITAGADGNLWFTETFTDVVGRVSSGGVFSEFSLPGGNRDPLEIVAGPDGNLWFTEAEGNRVGRITTAGIVDEFTVPTAAAQPGGITVGADGNLWFVEVDAAKIAKVTTTGAFSEYPIPSASHGIWGIVSAADGSLWFTQRAAGSIARLSGDGRVSEYVLPTRRSGPDDVAVGADGNLWVTENFANKIAKIVDHGDPPCPPMPSATCEEAVRASLRIRDHASPARRVLSWQWTGGVSQLAQEDFGDPASGATSYTLCIYDQSGGTPVYETGAIVPGGACSASAACWQARGTTGWRYRDKLGHRDGIQKIVLRGGAAGRSRVRLKGKGASLLTPAPLNGAQFFAQDTVVVAQLHSSVPAKCFSSTFTASHTEANTGSEFRARLP